MYELEDMVTLFNQANHEMIINNKNLFEMKVAERTFCGALMLSLVDKLRSSVYSKYYVDVEYNRNKGGKLKTFLKTVKGAKQEIIKINCDLIVHSRGENIEHDNLITIEMKKSTRKQIDKDNDRIRVLTLTKDSYDDVYSFDGKTLPEHVCRYILGLYYEIDFKSKSIRLEYYAKGRLFDKDVIYYYDLFKHIFKYIIPLFIPLTE